MSIRRRLPYIHTALAAFFLPMGVMYAITGGLYGLGIKGSYETTSHEVPLDKPLAKELSALVAIAEAQLAERDVALPTGGAQIKSGGTSFYLEWTGTRLDVELHPTDDPAVAMVKMKQTTPHRFFVQLHKAKGHAVFHWFAALWMIGLIALFLTGGLMAFSTRPYRRVATYAAALGILSFASLAFIS